MAKAIKSDDPAVAMEKTAAMKYATAAMKSSDNARKDFDRTAGYADARKARDAADAGKKDLNKHADLRMRVPWVAATTTKNAMTEIENAAKAAHNAAVSLERATNEDVMAARRNDIASALAMAEAERSRAGGDLTKAWEVHDAAMPFSEDGRGVNADKPTSGKTLRHPDGWISVNRDDARLWAADQELSSQGPYDFLQERWGITSYSKLYTGPSRTLPGNRSTTTFVRYQVYHFHKWHQLGAPAGVSGPNVPYEYVSYGVWGRADAGFPIQVGVPRTSADGTERLSESYAFVFADMSDLTGNIPVTGTASYFGNAMNYFEAFSGRRGTNGNDPVIPQHIQPGIGANFEAGTRYAYNQLTFVTATIDFATRKMNLEFNRNATTMWYDIEGIDLDASTGTFSGGKYLGIRGTGRTNNTSITDRSHDPFRPVATGQPALTPTVKLHGGVFGPQSDEIAGTIRLSATAPHGETAASGNLATAKDG